jgi:predicted methyltransferase
MDAVAEGMSVDPEDVPNPEDIPRPTEKLQKVDRLLASGLIRHLGLDIHDWRDLTKNTKGREIIHELELAALRRTFEGTCEICEGRGR